MLDAVLRVLLYPLGLRLRTMLVKDLKGFLRDPAQWSQFLIFFGLLGVYFLNLRSMNYHVRTPFWRGLVSLLNLMATCLTLSTFTSRFVFPQLSLEGRRFWIVGMAPMPRQQILWGKFLFSLLGSLLVSEVLIFVSNWMLQMDWQLQLRQAATVAAVCVGLSGLAAGLGAMYPNFREGNPSKIVSGFGGTLNLVLSLALVASIVGLQVLPYRRFLTTGMGTLDAYVFELRMVWGLTATVAALATVLPMWLGLRALERMEV